ncbi:MAG: cytochrome c3 family protein [Rhodospirillales bacterium]|nr:cytochrome c3 family protein [Rhodospirillales bacterium]
MISLAPVAAEAAGGAAAARQDGHSGLACASCHLDGERATPETGRRLTTTQVRICSRCHEAAVTLGHPAGFTPARALPPGYPLDWKGQMTCSSCHDFHGSRPGKLRRVAGRQLLCAACHSEVQSAGPAWGHTPPLASGHLTRAPAPGGAPIDGYSARCVQCHAEQFSLPGHRRVAFTASNGTGMKNHPIGSPYTQGDPRRELRSPALLPAGMRLPEGRVSCLSCHKGYTLDHGALVEAEGGLCTSCHDK